MTRRNGHQKRIHLNQLNPSTPDLVKLSVAVEERFKIVCELWFREKGTEIMPPRSLDADMLRWRFLAVRYKRGDYRNTEAEKESVKAIAEWTLEVNAILRCQPKPVVDWSHL